MQVDVFSARAALSTRDLRHNPQSESFTFNLDSPRRAYHSMDQQNSTQKSIVILGAGVIGLTIAHELSLDPSNKIIIVARDMPEDIDSPSQGWSSPWAVRTISPCVLYILSKASEQGADWSPMGNFDERKYKWESVTVSVFDKRLSTENQL